MWLEQNADSGGSMNAKSCINDNLVTELDMPNNAQWLRNRLLLEGSINSTPVTQSVYRRFESADSENKHDLHKNVRIRAWSKR